MIGRKTEGGQQKGNGIEERGEQKRVSEGRKGRAREQMEGKTREAGEGKGGGGDERAGERRESRGTCKMRDSKGTGVLILNSFHPLRGMGEGGVLGHVHRWR